MHRSNSMKDEVQDSSAQFQFPDIKNQYRQGYKVSKRHTYTCATKDTVLVSIPTSRWEYKSPLGGNPDVSIWSDEEGRSPSAEASNGFQDKVIVLPHTFACAGLSVLSAQVSALLYVASV